jgi:hypothetical protein
VNACEQVVFEMLPSLQEMTLTSSGKPHCVTNITAALHVMYGWDTTRVKYEWVTFRFDSDGIDFGKRKIHRLHFQKNHIPLTRQARVNTHVWRNDCRIRSAVLVRVREDRRKG